MTGDGTTTGAGAGTSAFPKGVAPALCLVTAGLVLVAGLRSGGYFPQDYLGVGALTAIAVAIGVLAAPSPWRPAPLAVVAIGALTALAAWTGLSAAWSPDPDGAVLAMLRTFGYAGGVLLASLAVGNGRHAGLLLRLVVAGLVVVCVVALVSRLRPLLIHTDAGLLSFSQGRLSFPISYWNGLGAVAAMAVLGCVGLAAERGNPAWMRALATAGTCVAGMTLYLTLSRASILAGAAALVVVLALSPRRLRLLTAAVLGLLGAAAGVLVLRGTPILIDRPSTVLDQSRAGGTVLAELVAITALAAAVQLVLALLPQRAKAPAHLARRTGAYGPALLAGAAVLAVVAAVGYVAAGEKLEGRAADGVIGARSFVNRSYGTFNDPTGLPSSGQQRLGEVQSSRSEAYRVARVAFRSEPLRGDGGASFRHTWFEDRRISESIRNAHSLELETLAELGLVGGGLLLALLAPLILGLRSLTRRTRALTRCESAAAGGIVVTFLVHSAVDWDWQLAGVTLPALTAGACLLATGGAGHRSERRRRAGMFAPHAPGARRARIHA